MNKERITKFHNSLAFLMGAQLMYVPVFTLVHQFHKYGLGMVLFVGLLGFGVFCYLSSYLLYLLLGNVGYMEVNQGRKIKGYFSLLLISLLLMAIYGFFFVEAEPLIRWSAWIGMVVILFIAAYSICKQYIMKND